MSDKTLDDKALDILFRSACGYRYWLDQPADHNLLRGLYNFMKWGPTGVNCTPARPVFVRRSQASCRLESCLVNGNVNISLTALVAVTNAIDMEFYQKFPNSFRTVPARVVRGEAREDP